jgi:hypothetical protein
MGSRALSTSTSLKRHLPRPRVEFLEGHGALLVEGPQHHGILGSQVPMGVVEMRGNGHGTLRPPLTPGTPCGFCSKA